MFVPSESPSERASVFGPLHGWATSYGKHGRGVCLHQQSNGVMLKGSRDNNKATTVFPGIEGLLLAAYG